MMEHGASGGLHVIFSCYILFAMTAIMWFWSCCYAPGLPFKNKQTICVSVSGISFKANGWLKYLCNRGSKTKQEVCHSHKILCLEGNGPEKTEGDTKWLPAGYFVSSDLPQADFQCSTLTSGGKNATKLHEFTKEMMGKRTHRIRWINSSEPDHL